jgi:hypothetical protein
MHEADDAGGTRHVALHVLHAGGGLDRNTPGIEADPLPMKATGAVPRLSPLQHDHRAAFMLGALPDADERVHAELFHLLDVEHLDADAEFLQIAGAAGEFFRVEHVRRLVDEIARDHDAARYGIARGECLLDRGGTRDRDRDLDLGRLSSPSLRLVL